MDIRFEWKRFAQLDTHELYKIIQARIEVFCVEQQCPFQDLDDLDQDAWHLSALNTDGVLLGYLRLVPPTATEPLPALGRIVTVGAGRGQGLGRPLVRHGLDQAKRRFPDQAVAAGAQMRLVEFYRSLGFVESDPPYLEDGIVHVRMVADAAQ